MPLTNNKANNKREQLKFMSKFNSKGFFTQKITDENKENKKNFNQKSLFN